MSREFIEENRKNVTSLVRAAFKNDVLWLLRNDKDVRKVLQQLASQEADELFNSRCRGD